MKRFHMAERSVPSCSVRRLLLRCCVEPPPPRDEVDDAALPIGRPTPGVGVATAAATAAAEAAVPAAWPSDDEGSSRSPKPGECEGSVRERSELDGAELLHWSAMPLAWHRTHGRSSPHAACALRHW